MANQGLMATSAFLDWHPPTMPGLALERRETLTIASLAATKGKKDALAAAIRSSFGADLPQRPGRVESAGVAFVWAAPDQWLVIAERGQSNRDLEVELKAALAGSASVVDLSDGRVVLRISGDRARDVLVKGVPVDLHPRAFRPGDVAITHASHIGVILWQVDEKPTYELAMFRSYADSFAHWLFDSAAEFASAP